MRIFLIESLYAFLERGHVNINLNIYIVFTFVTLSYKGIYFFKSTSSSFVLLKYITKCGKHTLVLNKIKCNTLWLRYKINLVELSGMSKAEL